MTNGTDKSMFEFTLGRSVAGSICGIAVIILAILGLVHIFPRTLLAIATIVFGVSLLFKGAVISAEYSKLLSHLSGSSSEKMELGGAMSIEIITGIAGIVLGVLALLRIDAETLIAISVLVFGAGIIMGSGLTSKLNSLKLSFSEFIAPGTMQHRVAQDMVAAAIGTQVLAGIVAIVLGILSLIGFAPLTLNLVALLVLGADSILSGSAVSERILGYIHNA